jgi:hypothetical protein
MSDRYNINVPIPKSDGGTFWMKVGVMFPTRNGGFSILLNAMPAPVDGQFKMLAFKDEPRDRPAAQRGGGRSNRGVEPGIEDEIPF